LSAETKTALEALPASAQKELADNLAKELRQSPGVAGAAAPTSSASPVEERKAGVETRASSVAKESACQRIRDVFNAVDADKNGKISHNELHAKLEKDNELEKLLGMSERSKLNAGVKQGVLKESWVAMVQMRLDASGDNEITWEEFEKAMCLYLAKQIFADVAGEDKRISSEELRAKLAADDELEELLGMDDAGRKLKATMTSDLYATIFESRIDESSDGMITWDEFEKAMVQAMQENAVEKN